MTRVVIRSWDYQNADTAMLAAHEAKTRSIEAGSDVQVVYVRLVTDPMGSNEALQKMRSVDVAYVTLTSRHQHIADDSPEMDREVQEWYDGLASMAEQRRLGDIRRNSGEPQTIPSGTIVYIKGVPYKLTTDAPCEGNTKLAWTLGQTEDTSNPHYPGRPAGWDVDTDVQYVYERFAEDEEYRKRHPQQELTDQERRALLAAMYASNGFEGYN